ncbi:MAG: sulfate reduction electron transfer complex DsrMKJOP subunit DsrJ [Desulfoferrobacter sp.]
MKIYDARYVLIGLAIFVVLFTIPFWYNMGKAVPAPQPNLDTPVIKQMAVKQCILPLAEMRTGHMQLLNNWRTWVVRDGLRTYVAADSKTYNISLQNTCMNCHSNKTQFCDQCHNYAGLKLGSTPYCWTCHIAPKENQ